MSLLPLNGHLNFYSTDLISLDSVAALCFGGLFKGWRVMWYYCSGRLYISRPLFVFLCAPLGMKIFRDKIVALRLQKLWLFSQLFLQAFTQFLQHTRSISALPSLGATNVNPGVSKIIASQMLQWLLIIAVLDLQA